MMSNTKVPGTQNMLGGLAGQSPDYRLPQADYSDRVSENMGTFKQEESSRGAARLRELQM